MTKLKLLFSQVLLLIVLKIINYRAAYLVILISLELPEYTFKQRAKQSTLLNYFSRRDEPDSWKIWIALSGSLMKVPDLLTF